MIFSLFTKLIIWLQNLRIKGLTLQQMEHDLKSKLYSDKNEEAGYRYTDLSVLCKSATSVNFSLNDMFSNLWRVKLTLSFSTFLVETNLY